MTKIITIARYTLIEALRNRLLWLVGVALLLAVLGAEFAGQLAITETREIQSALLAASLRLFAVFVTALFVISAMARESADKQMELMLSLPMTRTTYYLGKFAGFAAVGALIAAGCAAVCLPYAAPGQVLLWGLSLWCELLIIIGISLLCVMTFNQILAGLCAALGFYLLARSIAAMQLMAHGPLADHGAPSQRFMTWSVDGLAAVLPALDRFTQTQWLVYGAGDLPALTLVAMQTAIYVGLLCGAALFDFHRKNF